MKPKFETVFRAGALGLAALLFWAIWASAQPGTNVPAAAVAVATNAPTSPSVRPPDEFVKQVKEHEDYLTFGLDRIPALKRIQPLGQPLWKYIASLLFVLLAFYISRFLDCLTNVWLKRWSEKAGTKVTDLLVALLRGPIKVVTFVVFLNIGLDVFDWGSRAQVYLSKGFILVVACSLTYLSLKVIDLLVGLWRQRTAAGTDKTFDEQLFPVVSKSLKVFSVIAAVLVTSSNLGINITGALASLSVGALAVGLAAQDTLANLFGAIAVYIDKPFRLGDQIRLENVEGTVESIGLRSTRVRSLEGHHVTIPNKTVGNAMITNVTRRPNIKTEMNLGLTYDLPVEKLRRALKILEEVYRGHPMTADLTLGFNRFADSALNIQVVHWWNGTDGRAQLAGMQELNLSVKERFDAEGIRFAFPTQTIHVKQDSTWRVASESPAPPG